ncbi:MAG: Holliday junction resolvase RuvX [Candidatus Adlerbacteria bacterium]|nr:Holliday junction resolvase RuvX [Candidatus Adlerbacteria bacterium]
MKYLGIDYGTSRIGVATSDEEGKVAFPLTTVPAGRETLQKIDELVKKEKVEKIVIGESRNFKNEPNLVMEDIEQFKKDLEELTQLPVAYEPEFMTSAQAGREGETKDLDASAAALILQSYLERMKHHGSN